MLNFEELFNPETNFRHKDILEGIIYPWDPVSRLPEYITLWLNKREEVTPPVNKVVWGELQDTVANSKRKEVILYVQKVVRLPEDLFLKDYGIYIGKGTLLEPSALLKPPVVIGSECEIRQGAYIRGNVITGDNVIIGHNTEIKNSIIMNHSEAGHFSYIGDSLIGSYVNLGAGTKLANLQFRTMNEKITGEIRTIKVTDGEHVINTGLSKLGAIIGDGGELGCNCVTSPCFILGKNSKVFPTVTAVKGFYPPGSVIK